MVMHRDPMKYNTPEPVVVLGTRKSNRYPKLRRFPDVGGLNSLKDSEEQPPATFLFALLVGELSFLFVIIILLLLLLILFE